MGISEKIVCLAALGIGLTVCCPATGQPQLNQPVLDLTVWVENWAEVEPLILASAEKAAGKIFHNSGIKVNWRETSALLSPPEQGGTNLLLRISRSKDFGYPEPSLGFRWQRGPDDIRAIVFIDRVEQLARRSNARFEAAAVLGCAMTHELGHLLLGSTHSLEGVMRAQWKKKDVWLATQGGLDFTAEQAKLMREELYRRTHARSAH